jgi:uroporphyrinogen decarboxylase
MTKKQVVLDAINFRKPAYVPWSWGPTVDCGRALREYLGVKDLTEFIDDHFGCIGANEFPGQHLDDGHFRDVHGVVWDITVDKDIGTPCDWPIKEPGDLDRYQWPKISDEHFAPIAANLKAQADLFTFYGLGFSLFERAWTMRGMENLLIDMVERPEWVEKFLDQIVEYNLQQIRQAVKYPELDSIYFGDDYGMQNGLIMGISHWRHFIKPRMARMFGEARAAGKYVRLHSCGCVESLFDDLVEIGLNLFNPFQPEVMDTAAVHKRYFGRLAFHGGLSIQKILPFGSVDDVRRETRRLIAMGSVGGYILSPSHAVPRDVPPQNLVAMMEELQAQPGYK